MGYKKNRKIFACFVDFKQAFDSIPRDILLSKLLKHGICGKFFAIIKTVYTDDKCCVKINNKLTDPFIINRGVKQGCTLSPLLFNIFLADLIPSVMDGGCTPTHIDASNPLGCLL